MKDTVKYGLVTAIICVFFLTLLVGANALVHGRSVLNFWERLYTDTFLLIILLGVSTVAFYTGYIERKRYLKAFKRAYITKDSLEYNQFKSKYLRNVFAPRMILNWGFPILIAIPIFFLGVNESTTSFVLYAVWGAVAGLILALIAKKLKKS